VGRIGPGEIVLILLIVLLVFGANRLPELGKAVGRSIREFKSALGGKENGDEAKDGEKK
jgi:sec-independent protein translocase protein TatA